MRESHAPILDRWWGEEESTVAAGLPVRLHRSRSADSVKKRDGGWGRTSGHLVRARRSTTLSYAVVVLSLRFLRFRTPLLLLNPMSMTNFFDRRGGNRSLNPLA